MRRLQRGQDPRLTQTSFEQILQKVCPHGIIAAPFSLTMHTQQHTLSFPTIPSSLSSVSLSSSLNSDTLSDSGSGLVVSSSRNSLSAASASAKFIPPPGFSITTTPFSGGGDGELRRRHVAEPQQPRRVNNPCRRVEVRSGPLGLSEVRRSRRVWNLREVWVWVWVSLSSSSGLGVAGISNRLSSLLLLPAGVLLIFDG